MIEYVEITNYLDETIKCVLGPPYSDANWVISSLTGIDPGQAQINMTELSTNDGSLFNSARLVSREIVITAHLLPNLEINRHVLYSYFPLKSKVNLRFKTDTRNCSIDGYVKGVEIGINDKHEIAQITVDCPDPLFYDIAMSSAAFSGIIGKFTFPFCNNSLTEKLIEFSTIESTTENVVFYEGDAEVGFTILLSFFGSCTGIGIYNTGTHEKIEIDTDIVEELTGEAIQTGDVIEISTVKGQKYIHLIRGGVTYNILNSISDDSDWFQLVRGNNIFAYTCDSGELNVRFQVEYRTAYVGV